MKLDRRTLLQGAASATTAGLVAGGAALLARPARALPPQALRPPGALPEADFLGACVRCGLCVRDCPPGNLKLSRWGDGIAADVAIGTPFFEAREIPCAMCEDIPCVKACPTGALDPALTDITKAKMGVAVLIDHENCLNWLGLRCDVCYRVCPVIDQAITLEKSSNARSDRHAMFVPTVHAEHCTGCGMCEKSCVLERAAIKVLPADIARGELGHHYLTGWSPEQQARPHFDAAGNPRLPDTPVPGDLAPLRSGTLPYQAPVLPGTAAPTDAASGVTR